MRRRQMGTPIPHLIIPHLMSLAAGRLTADRAYVEALQRGGDPVDSRLEADWLSGPQQSNLEQARGR
jgi:hypothetical protein